MLVINMKNYAEAAGGGAGRMAEAAGRAAARHGVRVAVAPPLHLLHEAAGRGADVLAQHADDAGAGGTTGSVAPELLARAGVAGSIINHSERRVAEGTVAAVVGRLRALGMASVACAAGAEEAGRLARLGPDYVAVEPPELIGTGRSVSSERPGLIREAAEAVAAAGGPRLLCGAGIASAGDVRAARRLGAAGVLVASGVVRAASWDEAVGELAGAML